MMPGRPVADGVLADLQPRINRLIENGHTPGLGTILVGDDSASAGYIRMKQDKAAELGFTSPHIHLGQEATQEDVVSAIREKIGRASCSEGGEGRGAGQGEGGRCTRTPVRARGGGE